MDRYILSFLVIVTMADQMAEVSTKGYLAEPPARTSAWRFGFKTVKVQNDSSMACGGLRKKIAAGGRCGVCGDPFKGQRNSEIGGKWVTSPPTIVRRYKLGQWIGVKVVLDAPNPGYFKFRVCPARNNLTEVTMACLRSNTLQIEGFPDGKYLVASGKPIKVKLPDKLRCNRCVFQWDYTYTNKPDTPPWKQKTFRGCADISIT